MSRVPDDIRHLI